MFFQKVLKELLEIFLNDLFFERSNDNWIDVLPAITKHLKNRVPTSTNYHQYKLVQKRTKLLFTETF